LCSERRAIAATATAWFESDSGGAAGRRVRRAPPNCGAHRPARSAGPAQAQARAPARRAPRCAACVRAGPGDTARRVRRLTLPRLTRRCRRSARTRATPRSALNAARRQPSTLLDTPLAVGSRLTAAAVSAARRDALEPRRRERGPVGCTPGRTAQPAPRLISTFGQRAWRRGVTADEQAALLALSTRARPGAATLIRRIELGARGDAAEPTVSLHYELGEGARMAPRS